MTCCQHICNSVVVVQWKLANTVNIIARTQRFQWILSLTPTELKDWFLFQFLTAVKRHHLFTWTKRTTIIQTPHAHKHASNAIHHTQMADKNKCTDENFVLEKCIENTCENWNLFSFFYLLFCLLFVDSSKKKVCFVTKGWQKRCYYLKTHRCVSKRRGKCLYWMWTKGNLKLGNVNTQFRENVLRSINKRIMCVCECVECFFGTDANVRSLSFAHALSLC